MVTMVLRKSFIPRSGTFLFQHGVVWQCLGGNLAKTCSGVITLPRRETGAWGFYFEGNPTSGKWCMDVVKE